MWLCALDDRPKTVRQLVHHCVKAKQLVTHGLYRRFRRPIYLFGGIAALGGLVALQSWWLLGAWLLYAPTIQWTRLRRENEALEAALGDAFREHRKGTWI